MNRPLHASGRQGLLATLAGLVTMVVYAFITGALRALSVLHCQPFTLFQSTLTHQGACHEDRKQGA
ncbi:hypothetical protein [Serratia symbiotica]|uniref:hypothetical protein n=1 Tax=Serratia symbiotica TaxID=138074 RepID=UPI0030D12BF3|nr:hypothetical protein [Serratia symbiotica]